MGSSNRKYPVFQPDQFYRDFPHLDDSNHTPTSKATPDQYKPTKPYSFYNCFAFVVGDKNRFWWPGDPDSFWPREDADDSVSALMTVLQEDYGYKPCSSGDYEKGVQKVAIFAKNNVPVHIAIQPSTRGGAWLSKMGNNIDMSHKLDAIESKAGDDPETQGYGAVVQFLKRPKSH